jgi:hypothetical protein
MQMAKAPFNWQKHLPCKGGDFKYKGIAIVLKLLSHLTIE